MSGDGAVEEGARSPGNESGGDEVGGARAVGVRFRDSGQVSFFDGGDLALEVGDWVVVESEQGRDVGRVVVAPGQVRLAATAKATNSVLCRATDADRRRWMDLEREAVAATAEVSAWVRERGVGGSPVAAGYDLDRTRLRLVYAMGDGESGEDEATLDRMGRALEARLGCPVKWRRVGLGEVARLFGGPGRIGAVDDGAARGFLRLEQRESGVKAEGPGPGGSEIVAADRVGPRSAENERYRMLKAGLPGLGEAVETAAGAGTVVARRVFGESVTVQLAAKGEEVVVSTADLGFGSEACRPETPAEGAPAPLAVESGEGISHQ